MTDSESRRVFALRVVLRFVGTTSLLALIFVVAPGSWMASIHAALGMGELPEAPIVWYLARSTSAFYALVGGLFWLLSFDPPRYRSVLIYLGGALCLLGLALALIDWTVGMPSFWKVAEAPYAILVGLAILSLSRGLPGRPS